MGDAAGIGPELIISMFAQGLNYPAVVYGDSEALRRAAALLGEDTLRIIEDDPQRPSEPAKKGCIVVRNRWQALPADLAYGEINADAGRGPTNTFAMLSMMPWPITSAPLLRHLYTKRPCRLAA